MRTYARVEIPNKVKLQVFERAGGPENPRCEGECQLSVKNRKFEYHHVKAEWLQTIPPSQRDPIVAEDVQLLCEACHDAISSKDSTIRAHTKRIVAKSARIEKKKGRGFWRDPNMKKLMDGRVIDKRTGRPWGERDEEG